MVSNTAWATAGFGYGIAVNAQGDKLAAVYFSTDSIHLYDFNASTGVVTANLKIGSSMGGSSMYGLEFSPNSEILYMQAHGSADVRQFDLSLGTSSAISASEIIVGSGPGGGQLLRV